MEWTIVLEAPPMLSTILCAHHTGLTEIKFFFMPADGAQKVVWELPPAGWTYYALRNLLQHSHFLNAQDLDTRIPDKLAWTYLLSIKFSQLWLTMRPSPRVQQPTEPFT